MSEQLKDPVRKVIELLVSRQYAKVEAITGGIRLKAPEIAGAIAEYGRKLIPVPEQGLDLMDVVRVHGALPPKWTARIPLWTEEEGRSDLSVELTLIKDGQDFKIELDDIHVF